MTHRLAIVASILACGALASCENSLIGVPDVSRVELEVDPPVVRVGGEATLRGVAFDRDGDRIVHNRRLPGFISRDTSVATVIGTGTGTLRARAAGTVIVVAESGGQRDSVVVLVTR